jgi:hypothetical protein
MSASGESKIEAKKHPLPKGVIVYLDEMDLKSDLSLSTPDQSHKLKYTPSTGLTWQGSGGKTILVENSSNLVFFAACRDGNVFFETEKYVSIINANIPGEKSLTLIDKDKEDARFFLLRDGCYIIAEQDVSPVDGSQTIEIFLVDAFANTSTCTINQCRVASYTRKIENSAKQLGQFLSAYTLPYKGCLMAHFQSPHRHEFLLLEIEETGEEMKMNKKMKCINSFSRSTSADKGSLTTIFQSKLGEVYAIFKLPNGSDKMYHFTVSHEHREKKAQMLPLSDAEQSKVYEEYINLGQTKGFINKALTMLPDAALKLVNEYAVTFPTFFYTHALKKPPMVIRGTVTSVESGTMVLDLTSFHRRT